MLNSVFGADFPSGRYARPIGFFNVGEWVPLVTTPHSSASPGQYIG
jgi:hypothetical protein